MSQKLTAICVVDETGRRLWRGQCATDPAPIERMVRGHAGEGACIGLETGPMTPWLLLDHAEASLVAGWNAERRAASAQSRVMLAYRCADVAALNGLARERLRLQYVMTTLTTSE